MRLKIFASAFAIATTASPAIAQDQASFSGLNLAVLGGVDAVRPGGAVRSAGKADMMYGLSIGYDATFGAAVVGIDAEIAGSQVRKSLRHVVYTADRLSLSAERDIYLGIRGGMTVAPRLLAYAKAGYTNARFKSAYDDGFDADGGRQTLDGYRLGAGLEYRFARIGLRGEYRYSDYGAYRYGTVTTGIEMQRHQVVVGLVGLF